MFKVHNYVGLETRLKTQQENEQELSTQQRYTKTAFRTKSSFNTTLNTLNVTYNINKMKTSYMSKIEQYYSMKLVEFMGGRVIHYIEGLAPLEKKIEALKQFEEIILQIQDILNNMLNLIKSIDFYAPNFDELYQTDQEYLSDQIFRDIKVFIYQDISNYQYIEQSYNDFLFQSSLRYLPSVLQILQIENVVEIEDFEIHKWAQEGLDYILKQNVKSAKKNTAIQKKGFWARCCSCLYTEPPKKRVQQ